MLLNHRKIQDIKSETTKSTNDSRLISNKRIFYYFWARYHCGFPIVTDKRRRLRCKACFKNKRETYCL